MTLSLLQKYLSSIRDFSPNPNPYIQLVRTFFTLGHGIEMLSLHAAIMYFYV